MPIQIDHMDTAVEVTSPQPGAAPPSRESSTRDGTPGRDALRDAVLQVMGDELERYARMRGH